jgi:hypothetical protein
MVDNSYYIYFKAAIIITLQHNPPLQFHTFSAGIHLMAGKTELPAFF